MSGAGTVLTQVVIMFILMVVGFACAKSRMLSVQFGAELSRFLLTIVVTCLQVVAYQTEFDNERLHGTVLTVGLSLLSLGLSAVLASLIFRRKRKQEPDRARIESAASIYPNSGFMGYPLLAALLGSEGLFYGPAYTIGLTIMLWTDGILRVTGDRKGISLKRMLLNPGIISTFLGLLLYILQIRLPEIILTPMTYIADLNTPLAMILVGTYFAHANVAKLVASPATYRVAFLKLILFPFIMIFILRLLAIPEPIFSVVLISMACPTATTISMFCSAYGKHPEYSSELIVFTTALSIFTIPLMLILSQFIVF